MSAAPAVTGSAADIKSHSALLW